MDPRTYGPQIFPSAPLVKKRLSARLEELPPVEPARPGRTPDEEPDGRRG